MSLFRQDPFFSSSFFPRPFSSLNSLFDYPVSAPMYTLYDVPIEDRPRTRSSKDNQSTSLSTTSPSTTKGDQRMMKGAKEERMMGRQGKSTFSPLPFSSALSPFRSMPSMDMTIDMFSTPQAYMVHAAVPGLNKNDINITVDERVLTIEAERHEEKKLRSPNQSNQSTTTTTSSNQPQSSTQSSTSGTPSTSGSTTGSTTGTGAGHSMTGGGSQAHKEEKYPDADETKVSTQGSSAMMTDDNDVSWHHVESFYGRVSRRVQLPEDAKVDELTAKYEDGIIKIEIPRSQQEPKPRGRKIELQ